MVSAPFLARDSTKQGVPVDGYCNQSPSLKSRRRNPNTLGALKWRAECGLQVGENEHLQSKAFQVSSDSNIEFLETSPCNKKADM